jgi:phosphatidylserine/phosphatidylglycerophosphate/cardiolipin synthase-like enzyme
MLNPNRASGQRDNDATSEALKTAGVEVEWTNPRFMVTHEKSIVVDGERALIATFNLSSKYFSQTRDYGILTHDPNHVSEVIACFEADWKREPFAPAGGTSLLWSDANARSAMAAFVDGACHTLDIQNPKFMDTTILDRVLLAHDRGVNVRVLFGGRHGTTPGDVVDTFSSLRILQRAGVKVHRQRTPKLHAKLIVADGDRVLVGSQNIDRVAFDFRRELGVIVSAGSAVNRLKEVFREDWEGAKPYMVPDPLAPVPHDPEELPRDPDFQHE